MNKKTVAFILIPALALSFALRQPAHAKIYKRVMPDGTIEYYNKNEGAPAREPEPEPQRHEQVRRAHRANIRQA